MAVRWCGLFLFLALVIGLDAANTSRDTGFVRQPYHESDEIIFPGDLPYPFEQLDPAGVEKLQKEHQHAIEVILGVAIRLKQLVEGEDSTQRNFLVSPVSVAAALGQLLVGSRGKLRANLIDVLNVGHLENRTAEPYGFIKFHEEMGSLLEYFDNHPGRDRYTLKTASVMFLDNEVKGNLKSDYKHILENIYKSQIIALNFSSDPAGSMKRINKWGFDNTNGLIPQMLREPLPPYTASLMSHAVYFKGNWQMPFTPSYTDPQGKFQIAPGKTVTVPMMHAELEVKYAEDRNLGIRMIILPYKDYQAALYLIQPIDDNQLNLESITNLMSLQNVAKVINQTEVMKVSVSLPRLKLKSSLSLRKPLLNYKKIYLGPVTTLRPPIRYNHQKPGESFNPEYSDPWIQGDNKPKEPASGAKGQASGGKEQAPGSKEPPPGSKEPPPGETPKNASVTIHYNSDDEYPSGLPVIVIGPPVSSTERPRIPLNHARTRNTKRSRLERRAQRMTYAHVAKKRTTTPGPAFQPCRPNYSSNMYGAKDNNEYLAQVISRQGEEQTSQTGSIAGQLGAAAGQLGQQAHQAGQVAGQLGQHSSNFGNAAGQIGTSTQNIGSSVQQVGANPVTLPQNAGAVAQNLGQIGQGLGQIGQTTGEVAQMGGQGAVAASQLVQEGLTQSPPSQLSDRFGDSVENDFDMTGASSDPRFRIDDIIHQMSLEINEKGTEAAAVTITTVDYIGTRQSFNANRPFIFLIRHEPTSASLFWGLIANPLE